MAKRWIFNCKLFSLAVRAGSRIFRFLNNGYHAAFRAETAQEREVLSLSWISPRFQCYRSLAMFQLPQRQAGNLAAARFLLSVLKPEVFRPLRSARFLNRPHHLKFNGILFFIFAPPPAKGEAGRGF
jgi:hypothetical protein